MTRPARTLTGAGAVLLALVVATAGGLVDVLTGPGLRSVFAVSFVLGCALAALLVRTRDLAVTVVMPPLLYVVIALVLGALQGGQGPGSFLVRQVMDLFTALVLQAPALMLATGSTLLIALARGLGRRRTAVQA